MEISGGGGGGGTKVDQPSSTKTTTETKSAEPASPVRESNAPESPTEESAPRSEGVESLNLDPAETVSDPDSSENLVNEQASVAEELSGGTESTFPDDEEDVDTSEVDSDATEIETGAEPTEGAADPAAETSPEAAASSPNTSELEVSVVAEEEALAAIDAQFEAAGLPAIDPAHRPETIDMTVTPLETGSQRTVQTFEDPTGAYSGTFETVTDENGVVVERNYQSTVVTEYSVLRPSYDSEGQMISDSATMRESMTRSVQELLQEDGTFASSGEMTFTIENPPDEFGVFERSTVTGAYNSTDGEMAIERVASDGTVLQENRFPVSTSVEEPPALTDEGPFQQTEQLVHLPDGGTHLESRITDQTSGYAGGQSVVLDAQGNPVTRTSVVETPQLRDGVSGLAFMEVLGITSAANLMEDNIGPDPDYVSQTVTVERFGPDGQVSDTSKNQQHTWTSQDQSAELSMIDRGRDLPREYVLTRTEEGTTSSQSFIEGTEDTVVSVEEVDENGFRVVTIEADSSEAAEIITAEGQSAQEAFSGETRMKEEANLSDLQTILGSQYDALLQSDPAFAELVTGLQDETFSILDLQTSSTILNAEGERETMDSRGVSINLNGQTHLLVTDGEGAGLQMADGVRNFQQFDNAGAAIQSAGIIQGAAGELSSARRAAAAFEDVIVEGIGDVRRLTRVRRAAGALTHNGAMGAIGVVGDTIAAIQAAGQGDTIEALLSTGRAAENLGEMAPAFRALTTSTASLEARTVGFAARSLGVAGGLLVAGTGAYDLVVNKDLGGAFDVAAGLGGSGYLLAAGSGGTLGLLGTLSGWVGGAGVIGGLVYDYSDRHRLAPQQI